MKTFTKVFIASILSAAGQDRLLRQWKSKFSNWYYSKPVPQGVNETYLQANEQWSKQ